MVNSIAEIFNATLSARKIAKICYLGIHYNEDLKRQLEETSRKLGIPPPIYISSKSTENPAFQRAWSRFLAKQEGGTTGLPLTTPKTTKRRVKLPRNETSLRLDSKASATSFFKPSLGGSRKRQKSFSDASPLLPAKKRMRNYGNQAQTYHPPLKGGRPVTRSLTERRGKRAEHNSTADSPQTLAISQIRGNRGRASESASESANRSKENRPSPHEVDSNTRYASSSQPPPPPPSPPPASPPPSSASLGPPSFSYPADPEAENEFELEPDTLIIIGDLLDRDNAYLLSRSLTQGITKILTAFSCSFFSQMILLPSTILITIRYPHDEKS